MIHKIYQGQIYALAPADAVGVPPGYDVSYDDRPEWADRADASPDLAKMRSLVGPEWADRSFPTSTESHLRAVADDIREGWRVHCRCGRCAAT